jgi:hypothetical protein
LLRAHALFLSPPPLTLSLGDLIRMDSYDVAAMAFAAGVAIGGSICAVGTHRGWRRLRAHAKKSGSAGYMASSMISRGALLKLEAGDSEGAKRELGFAVANFYRHFDGAGEPPCMAEAIASERRQIETQAQSSAVLADALRTKSDE